MLSCHAFGIEKVQFFSRSHDAEGSVLLASTAWLLIAAGANAQGFQHSGGCPLFLPELDRHGTALRCSCCRSRLTSMFPMTL